MLDGNNLPGILLNGLVNRAKASTCDQLPSVSEHSAIEGDRNRTPQLLHHLVAIRHVGRHFCSQSRNADQLLLSGKTTVQQQPGA